MGDISQYAFGLRILKTPMGDTSRRLSAGSIGEEHSAWLGRVVMEESWGVGGDLFMSISV